MNKVVNEKREKQMQKNIGKPENPCGCREKERERERYSYLTNSSSTCAYNGTCIAVDFVACFELVVVVTTALCKLNNINRGMKIPLVLVEKDM